MHALRGDDIAFLGMAGLDDTGPMLDFVDRNGLTGFPHVYDADGSIWQAFGTITRSAFIFLDDDGTTTRTEYGVYSVDEVSEAIDRLLAD